MSVALAAIAGLIFVVALISIRLVVGPSLHDRVLAAHALALVAGLIAAAAAAAAREGALLDIAIMFVLTDFVIAAASLKHLRLRSFQTPLVETKRHERPRHS